MWAVINLSFVRCVQSNQLLWKNVKLSLWLAARTDHTADTVMKASVLQETTDCLQKPHGNML